MKLGQFPHIAENRRLPPPSDPTVTTAWLAQTLLGKPRDPRPQLIPSFWQVTYFQRESPRSTNPKENIARQNKQHVRGLVQNVIAESWTGTPARRTPVLWPVDRIGKTEKGRNARELLHLKTGRSINPASENRG
jgi:hypothetical protein